mgnify:CR=1 FL=1
MVYLSLKNTGSSSTQVASLNKANISLQSGNEEIDGLKCDTYGEFQVQVEYETSIPSLGTLKAITDNIMFTEKSFLIEFSNPPPERQFFYINETFRASVKAIDYDGDILESFTGLVRITDGTNVIETYQYTSDDSGQHIFAVSKPEQGVFSLQAIDANYPEIMSDTASVDIRYGAIVVESKDAPVGTVQLEVKVVDESGDVITEENALSFRVLLEESNPNSTSYLNNGEEDIPISNGKAFIEISDTEPEEVTVTPQSNPELDSVSGIVNFGSIGESGIRIILWREKR